MMLYVSSAHLSCSIVYVKYIPIKEEGREEGKKERNLAGDLLAVF